MFTKAICDFINRVLNGRKLTVLVRYTEGLS